MSLVGLLAETSEYRSWEGVCYVRRNKYGYIAIRNPHYRSDYDDEVYEYYGEEFIIRKPTPAERKEIVINTIIQCGGKAFRIPKLAELLAVSDRTIQ